MQCGNNLKQIGLATQSYHDSNGHLPPGIGYYPTTTNGTFGTSWFHLLPYVEQSNLYNAALGTVLFPPPVGPTVVYYPGNNGVYSKPVKLFLCPSDPSVGPEGVVSVDRYWFGALCYGGNALLAIQDTRSLVDIPQGRTRLDQISDGTSNTILHAEKYARCTNTFMAPAFQDGGAAWAYSAALVFDWQPPHMTLSGKAFQPGFAIPALVARGAPDAIGPRSKFQHRPTPFLGNCDPTRTATSHSSGMQVGLADGSVRTLAPSLSPDTWWALVTPSGNEVLGTDW
jgi:hypothetical protein